MIEIQCIGCAHRKICGYRVGYDTAVDTLGNQAYKFNDKVYLYSRCEIVFVAKCPHFLEERDDTDEQNDR